jgi:predicted small lipoprotein YifL
MTVNHPKMWALLFTKVIFTLTLLTGCGQKGPLFLPKEKPQNQSQVNKDNEQTLTK